MSKATEKLARFSEMVMQEANRKKNELKKQAELDKGELISVSEIQYLKDAYEKIQDALRKIEKEMNEEISKAIIESKQALFNRRDEIIDLIFSNVKERLKEFRKSGEYADTLENMLRPALDEVGQGELNIFSDSEDIAVFEAIRGKLKAAFNIIESEDALLGGFLIVNRTKGYMLDYSFKSILDEERKTFLQRYQFGLE